MENLRIKAALCEQSIYTYKNSDVLINKLDIKDQEELKKMDATLSCLRLTNLSMQENKFSFDIMHYLNIHKYIFQDIYPFAGDIRCEGIRKENITFCPPENIVNYLKYNLGEMKKDIRNIKTKEGYIEYLSKWYAEINMVHPFRDGNGRALREYLRQLVEYLNQYLPLPPLELNYSNVTDDDRKNLNEGSKISATSDDLTLLKIFFGKMLKEKKIENQMKSR